MDRRSISAGVRQWLAAELQVWTHSGILSGDQTGRILDLYETSDEVAQRKHSRAMFALSGVAAMMIGLAVLLLAKYIRGTISSWHRIECGIESYYVQEGKGTKYEQAARDRKLSAEVAITPDGRAALRGLRIEENPHSPVPESSREPQINRWPSNTTYRVRYLPHANIHIDGKPDEPEWSRANVERHFTYPWKKAEAPPTEFMAFCDDQYLYFAFRVEDADIVAIDKLRDKEDVIFEDRVEMYFSPGEQMKNYFCLEIDSRGRVFDYRGAYYRQLDPKWSCKGLETKTSPLDKGYAVEGRIPLATLVEMGFPLLRPGNKILCGLYRAEFSHDRSGKSVEQHETIHNLGRKPPGTPPIEEWVSWIDPKTEKPDFHVPASLGWLEIVE